MNIMPLKVLVQDKEPQSIRISLLLSEEAARKLLEEMVAYPEKHARFVVDVPSASLEIGLEVYRPGKSVNTEYQKNLQQAGWQTVSVSLL